MLSFLSATLTLAMLSICIGAPSIYDDRSPLSLEDVCSLPHSTDEKCDRILSMYYYDSTLGRCVGFLTGGCSGTANRFKTLEECDKRCPPRADINICELPRTSGTETCWHYMPRYYYNSEVGKCEQFVHHGCMATQNNFRSLQECEMRCTKQRG
ncbi:BPTI/Kunitz domain-containing protein-like isoform X2 [Ornithodoros turicata]|uniref:BPTI/Kunitz domain-containing protein-like isoform X2 n=1 Tax=Ornithodoros turicata TaxID=34597 RepID=UPI0031391ADF